MACSSLLISSGTGTNPCGLNNISFIVAAHATSDTVSCVGSPRPNRDSCSFLRKLVFFISVNSSCVTFSTLSSRPLRMMFLRKCCRGNECQVSYIYSITKIQDSERDSRVLPTGSILMISIILVKAPVWPFVRWNK